MSPTRCRYLWWMARLLWTGLILTAVLLVAGILWGLLQSAGDRAGSDGVRGLLLTVAVLWGLNFIALVVLSALAQLAAPEAASSPGETSPADTAAGNFPASSASSSSLPTALSLATEEKAAED